MYEIALSVSACLRSNTRVDVAWPIAVSGFEIKHPAQALALTPGGGKIGGILQNGFDSHLVDLSSRLLSSGRKIETKISPAEALISSLPIESSAEILIAPASQLPEELWSLLLAQSSLALVCELEDDELIKAEVFSKENISQASQEIIDLFNQEKSQSVKILNKVISIFSPITKLVIAGSGPIAEALAKNAELLGWQVFIEPRNDLVSGYLATLSKLDSAVIMGHDVESSSRNLMAALQSDVGYIGALGSQKMQENRADWLAYRNITDLSRVYGPAGLSIAAESPQEIAISILAESIKIIKQNRKEN
jgi:xanthine dehydrogenase accessory factor